MGKRNNKDMKRGIISSIIVFIAILLMLLALFVGLIVSMKQKTYGGELPLVPIIAFGIGIFGMFYPPLICHVVSKVKQLKTLNRAIEKEKMQIDPTIIDDAFRKYGLHHYTSCIVNNVTARDECLKSSEFSDIIPFYKRKYNVFEVSNLIYGNYNGYSFTSSYVHCIHETTFSSNRNDIASKDIFFGRIYKFNTNFDNSFCFVLAPVFYEALPYYINLRKMEFEAIKVNDKYSFFTNDEKKAFHYIKPQTIIDFINLPTSNLFISIQHGILYIISYGYNPFDTIKEEDVLDVVSEEIAFIDLITKDLDELIKK